MVDVTNEANLLASLCHPHLPCLFCICVKQKPFRPVMQLMVWRQRYSHKKFNLLSTQIYRKILFCAQLIEAVHIMMLVFCITKLLQVTFSLPTMMAIIISYSLISAKQPHYLMQAKFYHLSCQGSKNFIASLLLDFLQNSMDPHFSANFDSSIHLFCDKWQRSVTR